MIALVAVAAAQEAAPPDAPAPPVAPVEPVAEPGPEVAGEAELRALADEVARLKAEVEDLRAAQAAADRRASASRGTPHLALPDDVRLRPTGSVDVGFFATTGDGVAYARDAGNVLFPEHDDVPWVFYGDPWANPINADGDSADLGLDRTNLPRFDPIASGGAPSFLVNTVNQGLVASLGATALTELSVDFEPRQGVLGSPGDLLDVDLAYVEWIPAGKADVHLFAGKFEPVFGIEYRNRRAPDRFGVTPSLLARYTTGTPTGLKFRGSVLDGRVILATSLTNGGAGTEEFSHFADEIDANATKSVAGRLSVAPVRALEVGASGQYGAQDGQPLDDVAQWQVGADARFALGDLTVRGEYLVAHAEGGGAAQADALEAEAFYVDAALRLRPWVGVLGRIDRRDALLLADATNLYVSDVLRLTAGLRFDLTFNALAKLEVLHLDELAGEEIDDDVFTSSLVLRW